MDAVPPGNPDAPDTAELAAAAGGGDRGSLGRLFERLTPELHTWAALRISTALREVLDPEDLVQEIWSRALTKIAEFRPDGTPFRFWVFRLAKNVLLEAIARARVRRNRRAGRAETERLFDIGDYPDDATSASRRAARDEALRQFIEDVKALPEDDAELFVYCGLEGATAAEAARVLGIGEEAAQKRWVRLRERLRQRGLPRGLDGLLGN